MAGERPATRGPMYGDAVPARRGIGLPTVIALMVAALLVGSAFGCTVLSRLGGGHGGILSSGTVSLRESELDDVVATYVVDGKRHEVTYRDAILENGSLSAAQNADGSYRVPSADSVLAVARSQVISAEAQRLGITAEDAEIDAYALATFGTTDLGTIATAYGMESDAAAVLLREATLMSQLRDQALQAEVGEAPAAPAEPGEGEEVTMTQEYASYVIGLAGDEWDGDAGTWVSYDGPFASALADYEITSSGATYEAARQAYYVAYQRHIAALSDYSAQWTDYVNGLLGNASIEISTLAI